MRLIVLFMIVAMNLMGQDVVKKPHFQYKADKYSGTYQYGTNINKGPVYYLTIYAESDSSILFYFEGNKGAPNFSSGALYGRLKIKSDTGIYFNQIYNEGVCKIEFKFTKERLLLSSLYDEDYCGFGYGVNASGEFKKISAKKAKSFTNREGKEIFFEETKPEEYRE